jgi:hypothetical protein
MTDMPKTLDFMNLNSAKSLIKDCHSQRLFS